MASRESTPLRRRDSERRDSAAARESTPRRGSTPRDFTPGRRRDSAPRPLLREAAFGAGAAAPTVIPLLQLQSEDSYARYLEHSPRAPITPLSAPVHGRSASLVQMCKKCGARFRVVNFGNASAWMCYEPVDGGVCGTTWFTAGANYRACSKKNGHESHPEYQWGEYGAACTPCKKFVSFSDIELGTNKKKR